MHQFAFCLQKCNQYIFKENDISLNICPSLSECKIDICSFFVTYLILTLETKRCFHSFPILNRLDMQTIVLS